MIDQRHRSVARRVGEVVLVAAVVYVVYGQVSTQVFANQATSEKQVAQKQLGDAKEQVTDPLAQLCVRDKEVARRLGSLCIKAAEVNDQPTIPAVGRDGKDGRGIAATSIRAGHLWITYSDGATEDKGAIAGRNGKSGKAGMDGRSITGTTITDGSLVLSYSDGKSETVGQVVGSDGKDGRGVASITVNGDFRLIITYTDGQTVDVGPLPSGRDGRGIASVAFDMSTCTATVTYTDGETKESPMTGCDSGQPTTAPGDTASPPVGLLPGN